MGNLEVKGLEVDFESIPDMSMEDLALCLDSLVNNPDFNMKEGWRAAKIVDILTIITQDKISAMTTEDKHCILKNRLKIVAQAGIYSEYLKRTRKMINEIKVKKVRRRV